ncbi:hypothetical protein [Pontibacter sp. G13]|uniref:hypothetical protein n=1 Tax=Pontibacter sp. G13 TaxID=3074898 RepID=UPI00288B49FE|nr:hypothetical protein [Pontibacter sp. G13]WNJ18181.1 hypothetical protein RJD25_25300 [Pontibacter sp. G13]
MRKPSIVLPLLLLSLIVGLSGCLERPLDEDEIEFVEEILDIVPRETIDSLEALGFNVHEGTNPPVIDGALHIEPFELLIPFGPQDPWEVGKEVQAYEYTFENFDPAEKTVSISYHQPNGTDQGSGIGGIIAGEGNGFTIFSELAGDVQGIQYTQAVIMTGVITDDGVKDFQYAFLMTDKEGDDLDAILIPVGTGRIWIDSDYISEWQ